MAVWSRYGHAGPRYFALSEVDDADPSRNSDPDFHQQFDNALVDKPPRTPLPVGIDARHFAYLPKGEL